MLGVHPGWIAPRRDLGAARMELAASGIKDPTVNLGYASDLGIGGLPIGALASLVKADLGAAGIKVNLAGSPSNAAKAGFDAGVEEMGLWASSAAGSSSYLDFLPGGAIGSKAGWTAGSDPALESLGAQAGTTADPVLRRQLLEQVQGQLNEDGPYFPLVQPGRVIVTTSHIATIDFNPTWSVDLAAVTG